MGNAEPHHHLSVELNVRPSGFEHRETVEVGVVELVQFETNQERRDGDHQGEALVALSVNGEFVVGVNGELLLGLGVVELSFTDQLLLVFRKVSVLILLPVDTEEDSIEDQEAC